MNITELDAKSDGDIPFQASEPGAKNSMPLNEQRTFFSSIGNLFGFSRSNTTYVPGRVDTQLQELLGTATITEFLR